MLKVKLIVSIRLQDLGNVFVCCVSKRIKDIKSEL